MSSQDTARTLLRCLDLTSLNDGDTADTITALCAKAQTRHGPVAAVCVWPQFVAQARAALPASIRVAAVANFPDGALDVARAVADIEAIAQAGAQEIDVVLPYKALLAGQSLEVGEFLAEVRHASRPLTLKVIIESGELKDEAVIRRATQLSLNAGADFIKTSTGKTPVSATLEAARAMLDEIAHSGLAAAGFKASGGIRTVAQGEPYVAATRAALGESALDPSRLRFGASGLLDDILAVLDGQGAAAVTASGGY
ncbi:deoxyribose-phosphate aldolase [Inhella gelatinilytica]|uniref:Deoxyribose-phosphate aldolase n=1 Tax=Inhella gelatinilytica TaxID=2795030 RepID=A0A931J006_9BURK|nr:deoxyribose-phosphate aldolase [Inhella gelatinilytica]MBH9554264.1 deoxyribose-phosphate aldolase [Inhella gelatinilytica]